MGRGTIPTRLREKAIRCASLHLHPNLGIRNLRRENLGSAPHRPPVHHHVVVCESASLSTSNPVWNPACLQPFWTRTKRKTPARHRQVIVFRIAFFLHFNASDVFSGYFGLAQTRKAFGFGFSLSSPATGLSFDWQRWSPPGRFCR